MSELRADTITGSDGSSPVTLTKQSAAKAWFNLNAATPALRDSFNIASITDEGTGLYEGNFSSTLSNGNYSANGSSSAKGSTNSYTNIFTTGDETDLLGLHSTAGIRVNNFSNNLPGLSDPSMMQLSVHGDLA